MKYSVKGLVFPGTIIHPMEGRVDLHKANQKVLKRIHESGSPFVQVKPGDPPNEQTIEIKSTPVKPAAKKHQTRP